MHILFVHTIHVYTYVHIVHTYIFYTHIYIYICMYMYIYGPRVCGAEMRTTTKTKGYNVNPTCSRAQ